MRRKASGERLGVVVLGMHRSGTSMTVHLLGRLGFAYGGPLVEARADNPLGYWEHAGVVDVHNRFLNALERRWDDPRALSAEDFGGPAAAQARAGIRAAYAESFANERSWVLKDPRMCRLLPLWDEVFATAAHPVSFFHVVRDPQAVADSIAARDGSSREKSFLLWLRHNLESERRTRGRRRVWVALEDFLARPEAHLRRLCESLDLDVPEETLRDACADVVSPTHVHHQAVDWATAELGGAFPWIRDAHQAFLRLGVAEDATAHRELDRVAEELGAAERLLLGGLFAPLAEVQAEQLSDRAQLVEQAEEAARYARSLEEAFLEKEQVNGEHVASLRQTLAKKDEIILAQQARIDELEAEIAARRASA